MNAAALTKKLVEVSDTLIEYVPGDIEVSGFQIGDPDQPYDIGLDVQGDDERAGTIVQDIVDKLTEKGIAFEVTTTGRRNTDNERATTVRTKQFNVIVGGMLSPAILRMLQEPVVEADPDDSAYAQEDGING